MVIMDLFLPFTLKKNCQTNILIADWTNVRTGASLGGYHQVGRPKTKMVRCDDYA